MKRILKSISIFVFLGVITSYSDAQTNISLLLFGGITAPLADFHQDPPLLDTVREDWPYQMKIAYHFGASGIVPLDKRNKINLSFGLTYSSFSNNSIVIDPNGSGGSNSDNNGVSGSSITFTPKINVFTLNLGILYNFDPKKKLQPMLSLEGTGNFFSGNFGFQGASSNIYVTSDLKSTFRVGLQLGGALEYKINDNYGIFGSMKYNIANLLGKTAENSSQTASIAFGDKEHIENGVTRTTKTISYFQISVGAILYFIPAQEQK